MTGSDGATVGAMAELPEAARRFVAEARRLGIEIEPVVYPDGTKTAAQAAEAVGCPVSAIVKSIVFTTSQDEAVLVLVPGDLRVDEHRLAGIVGSPVRRAGLEDVRDATGYAAGGTPPFAHTRDLPVYADEALRRHTEVWAAAGTPTTVFPIALDRLVAAAGASWADVSERS